MSQTLPVPRLSATVYPPIAKGMFGSVVVTLGGRVRDPDESARYTVTSRRDHARSNRKFHLGQGEAAG